MDLYEEVVTYNASVGMAGGNGTVASSGEVAIGLAMEKALEEMIYYPAHSSRIFMDALLVGATLACFFAFAWLFFKRIFEDYEVRNVAGQALFSLVFALSCNMFELIIFEILDILDRNSRWWNWKIDLYVMMALLIVFIPFYMAYLFLSNYTQYESQTLALSTMLYGMFLALFYKIGEPFPIITGRPHAWLALEHGLSRVGVIGVSTFGVLSGVGAVYGPYIHVAYFLRRIDEEEILAKKELRKERGYRYTESSATSWVSNFFRGVVGLGTESAEIKVLVKDIKRLTSEISMLESVREELFFEINDLYLGQEKIRNSRTCGGRIRNMAGYILSCYCIFKIIIAAVNIIFQRVRKTDPISRVIGLILKFVVNVHIDVEFWSMHASFILVGVIVATQMRGFLINLVRLFHSWSSVHTSSFIIALSSEIMGMYFVSSVLLIRMNLPAKYRRIITDVLGDLEFHFYYHWNDLIFLISALLTISFLVVSRYSVTRTKYSVL